MGIQVESIKAGDGKHYPAKRQTVTVDYVGYLDKAGEKKFDSTFERGMLPCPSPWASTGALADSSCLFGAQLERAYLGEYRCCFRCLPWVAQGTALLPRCHDAADTAVRCVS